MIFTTIVVSLPALVNVGSLLTLLLFFYSVLGVFLFSDVMISPPLNNHANFSNFAYAFITLLRISTGDAWHEILFGIGREKSILFQCRNEGFKYSEYAANNHQTYSCGGYYIAFPYIFTYLILVQQIFLNLFIAIIL